MFMKKEEVRKEFFKLRNKGHSYAQCRKILGGTNNFKVTIRTLKRWNRRLEEGNWDLLDKSKKPHTIHAKITPELEKQVISLRNKTGWGEHKICEFFSEISHASVYRILNKHKLTRQNHHRKKRIKYIRWQRKNPNSLWQLIIVTRK